MFTLAYKNREKATVNAIRKEGAIPAVFYGPKEQSTSIAIKEGEFKKVWKEAGESSIINLKGNKGEEHEALIHDVDTHPVTGAPRHADFYVIEKGKKLELNIELEFTGVSEAVKSLGGTLVKVLHEVKIEALPKDLPRHISVDISALATLESQILAKDLVLPAGVTLITGADEVVASIAVTKIEEEEVKTLDVDAIELVDQKGKEPGAEGEEAAAAAPEKKEEKKK